MSRVDPQDRRVVDHPCLPSPEAEPVTFEFEGRRLEGHRGESLASALLANGYDTLGRSAKYHRPRGLTCFASACPNCAMTVNGIPGTLACGVPLAGGEVVRRERAWPRQQPDVLAAADRVSRFIPAGFQFRWFAHSRRLSHVAHRAMATLAGGRRMPTLEAARRSAVGLLPARKVDVAVVGGGAAGLAAALAAAEGGAEVILLERRDRLGGALRQETRLVAPEGVEPARGFAFAASLVERVLAEPRIEVLPSSPAIGWYEGNVLATATPGGVLPLTARRIVVASGTYEEPALFEDGDRPGVMFASAAQRLANVDRVRPGRRAVFVTSEPYGYDVAVQLVDAGVVVVAMVDARDRDTAQADAGRVGLQVPLHAGSRPLRAHGSAHVNALSIGSTAGRVETQKLACDTVVVANGRRPANEIALQVSYEGSVLLEESGDPGFFQASEGNTRGTLEALWVAGGAGGGATLEDALADGARVGRLAAAGL